MFTLNEMLDVIDLERVNLSLDVSPRLTAAIHVNLMNPEERDEAKKMYGDYIVKKFDMPNPGWMVTIMLSRSRKHNEEREEAQK